MPNNNYIQKLLKIKDQNITFSDVDPYATVKGDLTYTTIDAVLTYEPKCCTNCGCINENHNIIKHGVKKCCIKHNKVANHPFIINLKKQRFKCKECDTTFTADTSLVNKHCQISNSLHAELSQELERTQSIKDIAERHHVSWHTVNRINRQNADAFNNHFAYLPEVLSFDEFKSVKSVTAAMSFIYADGRTHEPIDIIRNRQQWYVINHFLKYPIEVRKNVKFVTMDMYSPYMGVVEDCFPNATIVIDRFHVVQHLNRSLNRIRIETMNSIKYSRPSDARKLKKDWKLILKNEDELSCDNYFTDRLYLGMVNERIKVDYLLSLNPKFEQAYTIINDLKFDIKRHDADAFSFDLMDSKKIPLRKYVRSTIQTLERYQDYIENALYLTLSNGHLEGINNKIKTIKRVSYGYTNFDNFRARVLCSFKTSVKNRTIRPLLFEDEVA